MIGPFTGEHAYLSNFFRATVVIGGSAYPTLEHYYQASKAATSEGFYLVASAPTPGEAKKRGRRVTMRPDFEQDKRLVMLRGVTAKFAQHPELRHKLERTGDHELIEVNTWGDRYWGMVSVPRDIAADTSAGLEGENWLGRILMMTRDVMT